MIVQTWPLLPCIPGQIAAAAPYMVQLMQKVNGIPDCLGACIRPKILCFILHHFSGKHHSWVGFIDRHLNKRIGLIIHEHGIILWPVLFNQVTLQHKSLQL